MRIDSETVLLQASDWNYILPRQSNAAPVLSSARKTLTTVYPSLPTLVDSLIKSFLEAKPEENGFWHRLAVYIGYLYTYVPALKDPSFANLLKYEHRQYHFDMLAGMKGWTLAFHKHEGLIREALRQGKYEVTECSASRDNEDLFPGAREARILASMPKPPTPEGDSSESEEEEDCERGK